MSDIRKTRWKPDTCGCVVELEWDASLPQEDRVHTVPRVEACAAHCALPSAGERYDAVLAENRLKNSALEVIRQNLPVEYLDPNQQIAFEPLTQFDDARLLKITLPDVTRAVLDSVQEAVDAGFGAGKVLVS